MDAKEYIRKNKIFEHFNMGEYNIDVIAQHFEAYASQQMPSEEESQMMREVYNKPESVYYHNGWNDCFNWLKSLQQESQTED